MNTYAREIGVLGDLLAGDRETAADLDPNVEASVRGAIASELAGQPGGIPQDALVYAAMWALPADVRRLPVDDALALVKHVLGRMVASGEITEVTYIQENIKRHEYHPRGTVFEIRPGGNLVGPDSCPPRMSNHEEFQYNSFYMMIERLTPALRANLMHAFCPRCGVAMEGHVCK